MYNSNMQPQLKSIRTMMDAEAAWFMSNKKGHSILAPLFSLDYDTETIKELFKLLIVDYKYDAWQSTKFTDQYNKTTQQNSGMLDYFLSIG